ncbi:hypothetical protein IT072_20765 (plasmid) [Leifsonia sp. ZF2019]|uniref:hypothetical protein n=1 Tax=Leifsonia sp. ZF2019 TaxID=2781978 RepID=UPI001CC0EB45|nr:hypothetical protein [Leifsonia sp. ZF2019]UAJ81779.1 hypothetical protein IT072_20765 [Leifsonia sp. ZF2019]
MTVIDDTTPTTAETPHPDPGALVVNQTPADEDTTDHGRTRKRAIGFITAALLVSGSITGGYAITVGAASNELDSLNTQLATLARTDATAHREYPAATRTATGYEATLAGILGAPAGSLDPLSQRQLQHASSLLNTFLHFKPATPITAKHVAADGILLPTYIHAIGTAKTTVDGQTPNVDTSSRIAHGYTIARQHAQAALATIAATLKDPAAAFLAANPKADQNIQNAFTAETAVVEANKNHPAQLPAALTAYVNAATQLVASQQAALAAEAAAAAAAAQAANTPTYTDPTTGHTITNPHYNSSGGTTHHTGSSGNGGGNGGSTGGSGNPGGTGTGTNGGGGAGDGGNNGGGGPAPVDHTPHVTANGDYRPGCDGFYMYSQSTNSGGGIIIDVDYSYTYTTYSTDDGWGLKVYDCDE